MGVIDAMVGLSCKCDLQDGDKTETTDHEGKESVEYKEDDLHALGMDVVLDDLLHPETHMHDALDHRQRIDRRDEGIGKSADDLRIRSAGIDDQEDNVEKQQRDESDRRHSKFPEMVRAAPGRTKAADFSERSAHIHHLSPQRTSRTTAQTRTVSAIDAARLALASMVENSFPKP